MPIQFSDEYALALDSLPVALQNSYSGLKEASDPKLNYSYHSKLMMADELNRYLPMIRNSKLSHIMYKKKFKQFEEYEDHLVFRQEPVTVHIVSILVFILFSLVMLLASVNVNLAFIVTMAWDLPHILSIGVWFYVRLS